MSVNPTNYSGQIDNQNETYVLLQDGTYFLLLQNGVSKLILEEIGFTPPATNYSKTNPNATNYIIPTAS